MDVASLCGRRIRVVRSCFASRSGRSKLVGIAVSLVCSCSVIVATAAQVGDCLSPHPYAAQHGSKHQGSTVNRSHAIAMHGEPRYASHFKHFDYVNPQAPQGGRLNMAQRGTFDSFNSFIDKGNSVATGSIETLTIQSEDEPFTQYGLLASRIEWPDDRSWVTFYLNPGAPTRMQK